MSHPDTISISARSVAIAVVHAVLGWGLCGVTMFVGMDVTTPARALIIHAVAAPIIFAVVSFAYFRRSLAWPPLVAAAVFLATVVALDFFVVAFFIEKSFEMFRSVEGAWLPFALIFASTLCTGLIMRQQGRAGRRKKRNFRKAGVAGPRSHGYLPFTNSTKPWSRRKRK